MSRLFGNKSFSPRMTIVCSSNRTVSHLFSLAVSNRTTYISLQAEQPTASCIAIFHKFHKYCCHIKYWGIMTNLTMKSLGVYYWDVKMLRCGYVEHGLEYLSFYVQKHIAHLAACSGTPLVRNGPPAFLKLAYWLQPRYAMPYSFLTVHNLYLDSLKATARKYL